MSKNAPLIVAAAPADGNVSDNVPMVQAAAVPVMGIVIADPSGRVQRLSAQVVKIATVILVLAVVNTVTSMFTGASWGILSLLVPFGIFYCAVNGVKHRRKDLICCFSGWSLCFAMSIAISIVLCTSAYFMLSAVADDYTCSDSGHFGPTGTCVCCPHGVHMPVSNSSGYSPPTPSKFDDGDNTIPNSCIEVASNAGLNVTCDANAFRSAAYYLLMFIISSVLLFTLWCCAYSKGRALLKEPYFGEDPSEIAVAVRYPDASNSNMAVVTVPATAVTSPGGSQPESLPVATQATISAV